MFTIINDINDMYQQPLKETKDGFQCPVCKKKYKVLKRAETHMSEQDCYDIKALVRGKDIERDAYEIFKSIQADQKGSAKVNITVFRRSKMYSSIVKFSMYCTAEKIRNPLLYFAFVRDIVGFKFNNAILTHARKDQNLHKYRRWLRENPEYIDNEMFMKGNQHIVDPDSADYCQEHLVRSLERSHLCALFYMDYFGIDTLYVERLDLIQRLDDLYSE